MVQVLRALVLGSNAAMAMVNGFGDFSANQFTSMVVTLNAGRVRVKVEPLTGIVPMETGWTVVWFCALAAVI